MERNRSGEFNIAKDLATQMAKNLLMRSAAFRRWRLKRPRSAAHTRTEDFLAQYAFASLNLLLEHTDGVKGSSVCEIGPGDYLTSGLSILAAGASRYCVIEGNGEVVGEGSVATTRIAMREKFGGLARAHHRLRSHACNSSFQIENFP